VIRKGEIGRELYLISRGEVEVIDGSGNVVATLGEGNFFGEISLLTSAPRTATVRAKAYCDLFVLDKSEFTRVLRDRPQFRQSMMEAARARYNVSADEMLSAEE
jgi:CRP-like cAMP-binding protein